MSEPENVHRLGADAEFSAPDDEFVPEPVLPEPVRQRVIAMTAAVLSGVPQDELPVPLRKVAKFAPNRRARMGGPVIAAHLTADPVFRRRISQRVIADAPDLGEAIVEGVLPAAADPVEVAAMAYLARPRSWRDLVEAAEAAVRAESDSAAIASTLREAEQRTLRAEHDRAMARVEVEKLRDELAKAHQEMSGVREEARATAKALREAQAALKKASDSLSAERGRLAKNAADHEAEIRRLRGKLAEAEASTSSVRQEARQQRAVDEARLWLLLETIGQAAVGLRRELALDPATILPGDVVGEDFAERPSGAGPSARAQSQDDPARLDQLLGLPKVHLIVDGYNVTKRGYPEISLEQQRSRLISALGGLAAQTRVEVTCVFDGAEKVHGLPPNPRGVRVLFSRKGESADELVRRLVRAEPSGRPVVVVSSDREVADGVRRHGAYPMAADSLLRRLSRG
jgi:predicted RNA-binding protein with PIN domain